MVLLFILCVNLERRATVLTPVNSASFFLAAGVIGSVVMAVLLALAVVFIVALLAVVLKQRKQIQRLAVVLPSHVTPQPIYDYVTDNAERQNIELTENTAYGRQFSN